MREATAGRIEQLIKLHMPTGAVGYFFQQITTDNCVLRFPNAGCFKLIAPFEYPIGVPNGTYQVFFVRSPNDTQPLPPRDPENPFPEVDFYFKQTPATHAAPAAAPPLESAGAGEVDPEQSEELRAAQLGYIKRRLAMKVEDAERGSGKSKRYTQEIGEAFELNRAYRHELADSAHLLSEYPKRMVQDAQTLMSGIERMNEMSMNMIALHQRSLEELAKHAPPPPPPWLTLMQTILPILANFGMAAFSASKLGAGAPPEVLKAVMAALAALTPPASSAALPPQTARPALTGHPYATGSSALQPEEGAQGPPPPLAAVPQPTTQGRIPAASLPPLPPIAEGALTVQDIQQVLLVLQKADAPWAKELVASWVTMADQLIPERGTRRAAAPAPPVEGVVPPGTRV